MSKRKKAKTVSIILMLCAVGSAWALPPGLSKSTNTWFEVGFGIALSPARGESLIGWRFSFVIDSPFAFSTTVFLSETGGYGTFGFTYFYDSPTSAGNVAFPLGAGIGFSRRNEDISFALAFSGGASWYPISIPYSTPDDWIIACGAEVDATLYVLLWGLDPVFSTHVLMPVNLSIVDAGSP
jgi:hypothetical protein